jgi:hypothetical protein
MFRRLSPVTEPNRESRGRPNTAPLSQILQEPSPQTHAVSLSRILASQSPLRHAPVDRELHAPPLSQILASLNSGIAEPIAAAPASIAEPICPFLAPRPLLPPRRCSGLHLLSFSGAPATPSTPKALLSPPAAFLPSRQLSCPLPATTWHLRSFSGAPAASSRPGSSLVPAGSSLVPAGSSLVPDGLFSALPVPLWTCSGVPVRPHPRFHALGSDFLSLGVLGVLDVVGILWMVLVVALHGGMSSNVWKNFNFYIRHPIGYLTVREVYFPAPSK